MSGPSLALLADRLEGKLPNAVGAGCRCARTSWSGSMDRAEEARFPLTPQRIVHDVRKVMPDDGIVALDNGMYKIWFARNYRTLQCPTRCCSTTRWRRWARACRRR